MIGYEFYTTADARQDDIWDYTFSMWGEKQAEIYIRNLHKHLSKLAARELPWRAIPQHLLHTQTPDAEVYFSRYKHHIIFFRQLSPDKIGIMTILHEAMDITLRLQEDLLILDRDNI